MKENKFEPGELVTFKPTSDEGLDPRYAGKTCVVVREIPYDDWPPNYEVLVDGLIIEVYDSSLTRVKDEIL